MINTPLTSTVNREQRSDVNHNAQSLTLQPRIVHPSPADITASYLARPPIFNILNGSEQSDKYLNTNPNPNESAYAAVAHALPHADQSEKRLQSSYPNSDSGSQTQPPLDLTQQSLASSAANSFSPSPERGNPLKIDYLSSSARPEESFPAASADQIEPIARPRVVPAGDPESSIGQQFSEIPEDSILHVASNPLVVRDSYDIKIISVEGSNLAHQEPVNAAFISQFSQFQSIVRSIQTAAQSAGNGSLINHVV